jgi:branched-chain amino acid aminotransferase
MSFIIVDGVLQPAAAPCITAVNSAFRYGYGLFETMKVRRGKILLETFHWDRLWQSLRLLRMDVTAMPDPHLLQSLVLDLCNRNNCIQSARVRLQVSANTSGQMHYLLEAIPLDEKENNLNEKGWVIDIYPYARKSCEAFANLKSSSHLSYIMAGKYAAEKGLDDCLLLNEEDAICDSSIANVFLFKEDELVTPALHQGCINGVMRRWVLEQAKELGYIVRQERVLEEDLVAADEIFLTNAIRGIRWVSSFRGKTFSSGRTAKLYAQLMATFYHQDC